MNKILQRTVLRRTFHHLSSMCLYIFDIHLRPSFQYCFKLSFSAIAFFHLSSPALGDMLDYEDDRLGIVMNIPLIRNKSPVWMVLYHL
jgi:hypothetical protein